MEMLRDIDPPLGFGKDCPERQSFKKLIRMNMPMDQEGKVSAAAERPVLTSGKKVPCVDDWKIVLPT
jgi:hypothetical protein